MDSPERIAAWGSVVVLVIGTISKTIYDFIKNKNIINVETTQKISKNEQKGIDFVLSKYQVFIEELKESLNEAKEELRKIHVEHMNCREESARLQTRIAFLEEKITTLEKRLGTYNKDEKIPVA